MPPTTIAHHRGGLCECPARFYRLPLGICGPISVIQPVRFRHHWIFRPKTPTGEQNHRWHWEQHLTPRLLASLTADQKSVLMLGDDFEIDPASLELALESLRTEFSRTAVIA